MAQPMRSTDWSHDGPAYAQHGLTAGNRPIENARNFRHQSRKALRDVGRRRARGIGGAPDYDTTLFTEFSGVEPG